MLKKSLCLIFALMMVFSSSVFALDIPVYEEAHEHSEMCYDFDSPFVFILNENGRHFYIMAAAACCSSPRRVDYKEGHVRNSYGCRMTYVAYCSNCGSVQKSPAETSGPCASWCNFPEWTGC